MPRSQEKFRKKISARVLGSPPRNRLCEEFDALKTEGDIVQFLRDHDLIRRFDEEVDQMVMMNSAVKR
jgi:hypothetical protein